MTKALQNSNLNGKSVATVQQLLTSEDMVTLSTEELMARLKASPQGFSSEQASRTYRSLW